MTGTIERQVLNGITASQGVVLAPLWIVGGDATKGYQPKSSPENEAATLKEAIQTAFAGLSAIAEKADNSARNILDFQLAILADDTFYEAARQLIDNGETAYHAWQTILDQECASYLQSKDQTFQARAVDLEDIQARVARVLLNHRQDEMPQGKIVFADNLTPSAFIAHDWKNGGVALSKGSTASHVAVLARQFNVPMVVNLQENINAAALGERVLLAAGEEGGKLILSPTRSDEQALNPARIRGATFTQRSMQTRAGERFSVMVNLAQLRELDLLDVNLIDGIGLVRTEFLFASHFQNGHQPDEQTQFEAYSQILKWAGEKPVFVRTFDLGGDKPFGGSPSQNIKSQLRGIRLSLANPEPFGNQIRALLRASAIAPLHVTLPMVASEADFFEAVELFEMQAAKLAKQKIAHQMPNIGIMVEVPSVALTLRRFSRATHFSIGTNDLLQYTLAEPREALGRRSGVDHPAIMALIKDIVAVGTELKKPVSVCGDAASTDAAIPYLLDAGVRHLSVGPPRHATIVQAVQAYIEKA